MPDYDVIVIGGGAAGMSAAITACDRGARVLLFEGEKGHPYFFALGRSIQGNERTVDNFRKNYFLILPGIIFIAGLLGWVLAGRAIRPLNLVAATAREITGCNLSLRIPRRDANDELDNLIDAFNRIAVSGVRSSCETSVENRRI